MNGWYVAFCKPSQESVAKLNAENQGFEVYLPLLSKQHIVRGTFSVTEQAMFPRYLFVRPSTEDQSVRTLKSTHGIVKLVQFGFELGVAPNELIEQIRALEQQANEQGPDVMFWPGDQVDVIDGPFKGFTANVLSSPSERVKVLLDFLGQSQEVSLPTAVCRKAQYA